jgi:hypothetical protein
MDGVVDYSRSSRWYNEGVLKKRDEASAAPQSNNLFLHGRQTATAFVRQSLPIMV